MKRILAITFTLILVLAVLTGCMSPQNSSGLEEKQNPPGTESTSDKTPDTDTVRYLIQENTENVISFPIPTTKSMSAEEITFIQNFVQNKLLAMTGEKIELTPSSENVKNKEQAYSLYSILMETRITYESDTHISIVFNGLLNRKNSAHPTHWLFSLNYSPQTLQIIPFSEKYTANNQLYVTFADLAEKAIKEACAGVLPAGWESFKEPIPSEKAFLDGMLAETEFCYYLQENGVVISYPVPFALGDHKEVTIPYSGFDAKQNPPSNEQETQPSNPPVPGEINNLNINSLDKLNYYAALRMIAETPTVSKQSMTGGSPKIVLLAGGVGDDSAEVPTVPDATELAPTVPDATELAPTVPDATELAPTVPDATELAPTVPDATEPVPTEGPPVAPDNPDTTNPGKDIIYYTLEPNQPFNMKKVNMFQIELTDENGFLASKLGLGLVDVVISENCIWGDSLITFRNGDKFFSCLTNGWRLNTETGGQQWNFSTHKYVEGFNIVKNFKQENYAFYIDADAEGQIFAFECRGWDRADQNVRIVSATRISTQGGEITIAELEDYFNNGSTL